MARVTELALVEKSLISLPRYITNYKYCEVIRIHRLYYAIARPGPFEFQLRKKEVYSCHGNVNRRPELVRKKEED